MAQEAQRGLRRDGEHERILDTALRPAGEQRDRGGAGGHAAGADGARQEERRKGERSCPVRRRHQGPRAIKSPRSPKAPGEASPVVLSSRHLVVLRRPSPGEASPARRPVDDIDDADDIDDPRTEGRRRRVRPESGSRGARMAEGGGCRSEAERRTPVRRATARGKRGRSGGRCRSARSGGPIPRSPRGRRSSSFA